VALGLVLKFNLTVAGTVNEFHIISHHTFQHDSFLQNMRHLSMFFELLNKF